jgi:hypothetical protein
MQTIHNLASGTMIFNADLLFGAFTKIITFPSRFQLRASVLVKPFMRNGTSGSAVVETSRKAAGSIPDEVNKFLNLPNPSGHTGL